MTTTQEELVRRLQDAHVARSYGAPEATSSLFGDAAREIRELLLHIERQGEALRDARAEIQRQEAIIRGG